MKRQFFLIMAIAVIFGTLLVGCPNDNNPGENGGGVSSKFIGKWELKHFIVDHNAFDLPYGVFTTGGIQITSNAYTKYKNGTVIASGTASTYQDIALLLDNENMVNGNNFQVSGIGLIEQRNNILYSDFEKVTKFSWEPPEGPGGGGGHDNSDILGTWNAPGGTQTLTFSIDSTGVQKMGATEISFTYEWKSEYSAYFITNGSSFTAYARVKTTTTIEFCGTSDFAAGVVEFTK